ncbi:MAG: hypothetical protein ACQGVC_04145 [Myxococcota bacterium]
MSTKPSTAAADQAPSPNGPDFIAYQVIDRTDGQKAIWRQIGSAWMHNDGNGIQLRLDALPLGGSVTLRAPLPPKGES